MVAPAEHQPKKRRKKNPVGRPPVYDQQIHPRQVREMTADGRRQEDIAKAFGVTVTTLYRWRDDFPEFGEAIKQGWRMRDGTVVEALYHKAVGYSHPDVHIAVHEGQVIKTPIVKHYPPSEVAAKFILTNRRPGEWREKIDVSVEAEGLVKLTPEEMARAWAANYRALAPIAEQHAKAIEMKNVTGTGEK